MDAVGANREILSVASEQRGHTAHLRLSGELDIATSPVLERWLQGAESNGNSAIVLDVEHVTFVDASGIHSFLGAAQRASRSGRTFAIVKAPAVVRRVLHITRTTHLLGADELEMSALS